MKRREPNPRINKEEAAWVKKVLSLIDDEYHA